jgi:hypothetical protein
VTIIGGTPLPGAKIVDGLKIVRKKNILAFKKLINFANERKKG